MAFAAKLVLAAGWTVAGVLVIGVALVAADANEGNAIVAAALDVGRFFAAPFRGMFELDDNDVQIGVNWGIAAVLYAVAGILLSGLLVAAHARLRRSRPAPSRG